jgi:hypothetical protein
VSKVGQVAIVPALGNSQWIVRWTHPGCPTFHEEPAVAGTPEDAAGYFRKVTRKLKSLRCRRRRVRTDTPVWFVRPDPLLTLRSFLGTTAGRSWAARDPARTLSYVALHSEGWVIFDVERNHRCSKRDSSGPVILLNSHRGPLQSRCAACDADLSLFFPWRSSEGSRLAQR